MTYLVRLKPNQGQWQNVLWQGISKYIFFDPIDLSQTHNENIVYQLNLDIDDQQILNFINYLTGRQRLTTCLIRQGIFHTDLQSLKRQNINALPLQLDQQNTDFNVFYTSFDIGSRTYCFYEIGIDIHLNKRKKNGQIDHGNIEIKYRTPNLDPLYSQDRLRDSMIVLNFHINPNNHTILGSTQQNFLNQLEGYVGVNGYFRTVVGETDISQLESMHIINYNHHNFIVANESQTVSQTVLSFMTLKRNKENLETEKEEMLQFFNDKMQKTNSNPLTFQCNDLAITEAEVTNKFPGCIMQ